MNPPNYYAIIPAPVRYSTDLKPNAKLLYGEITALCNQQGFCWATNDYFAELYGCSLWTISRWISQLQEFGFIDVQVLKSKGNKRKITIAQNVNTYCQKAQEVLPKSAKGIAQKRTSYKENITNNTTMNDEAPSTALGYLKENHESVYEDLMMKYHPHIPDSEWNYLLGMFNATCDKELVAFEERAIRGRFTVFVNRWIRNNKRKSQQQDQERLRRPDLKRIG